MEEMKANQERLVWEMLRQKSFERSSDPAGK